MTAFTIKNFGHFEADKQGKVQFIPVVKETVKPKAAAAKTSTTAKATAKIRLINLNFFMIIYF